MKKRPLFTIGKTPEGRMSFPSLFQPNTKFDPQNAKFEATLVFPKGADVSAIEDAVQQAVDDEWPDGPPDGVKSPLRDNADREGVAFEGHGTHAKFTSKRKPQVINRAGEPCEESEIYGGCWGKVTFSAKAWNISENPCVALYMQAVLKTKDDAAFGGGANAADAFADDLENDDSYSIA